MRSTSFTVRVDAAAKKRLERLAKMPTKAILA